MAAVVIPIAFAVVVLMDLIWDSDTLLLLEILLAPLVLGLASVGVEAIRPALHPPSRAPRRPSEHGTA